MKVFIKGIQNVFFFLSFDLENKECNGIKSQWKNLFPPALGALFQFSSHTG